MFKFNETIDFPDRENDVLAAGELLIDMITSEYCDDFTCDSFKKFFGGSPANIAMNTKRLGIHSIVVSAVGNDGFGRFLINHLEKAGIDSSCVEKTKFSTSLVVVSKSKNRPVPIFYREADYHLEYREKLEQTVKNSKILHFSCWPISKQPSRNTIEKMIEVARENKVLICFDPNYHPMIWDKEEDGTEYVKSIIHKVDIIKPSEDDAERLFGKDSPRNQIDKYLDLGAKLVIMTLGDEGAIVSNGQETIKFYTLATEVVDTTGAGDAFWSGFYAGIVKGYTIREALDLGFAVSAYKLKYLGAVVELPKIEEIKRMYKL
ncbi:MAG: sugar kinase [Epulopiscium sp.]|nr:sugar kinase [Candidatus Epulonipiscium sp.]